MFESKYLPPDRIPNGNPSILGDSDASEVGRSQDAQSEQAFI